MNDSTFSEFDTKEAPVPVENQRDQGPGTDLSLPKAAGLASPHSLISPRETLDFQIRGSGKNKLLELAMPLLGLSVRIRNMGAFENIDELHSRLTNEIANFQAEATALGYDDATTLAARYCLCSMVDESVLSQPWGADSIWPERPMLSIFHNETWGGEKVFAILDRVLDEAHRFMDLLEFLYFCLALGFEGKYHVMHNGNVRLEALLDQVYKVLEKHSGEAPDKLLNPDANIYDQTQRMSWRVPIWSVLVAAGCVLVGVHLYFDSSLTQAIDDIGTEIEATLGIAEGEDA